MRLALLASFWLAAAPAAAQFFKPLDHPVDLDGDFCAFVEGLAGPVQPARCEMLREVPDIYRALLASAGFSPTELPFELSVDRRKNAHHRKSIEDIFLFRPGRTGITLGTLLDERADRTAVISVLAHEVAHAAQRREGLLDPGLYTSRQIEAHADLFGAQIAARAGFDGATFRRGQELHFGCRGIRGNEEKGLSHPALGVRWLNTLLSESAVMERASAGAAYGNDKYGPPTPIAGRVRPLVTPAAFTRDGLLKPAVPIPPAASSPLDLPGRALARGWEAAFGAPPSHDPRFEEAVREAWDSARKAAPGVSEPELRELAVMTCGLPDPPRTLHESVLAPALPRPRGLRPAR